MLPVKRSCNTQLHNSKVYMSFVNNLHLHFQESKFTFLEKERERERSNFTVEFWKSKTELQKHGKCLHL
jgi:hypothetical protein